MFAPRFATYDPAARTFVHHDTADPDPERRATALTTAYSEETLITRFDADGAPTSSSTEPSLMATMLHALDAQPGHRVLEIGTGYNAALLCHALGPHNITTIDVDPDLVTAARAALATAGYHPAVVHSDGAAGVPDRAPFDRIIATCGVDRVPAAWLTQLAPGGAILVNISKGIALLRHHNDDHGTTGRFLNSAGFMPLRSPDDHARWDSQQILRTTAAEPDTTQSTAPPPDIDFATAAFFANLIAPRGQLVFVNGSNDKPSSYRWVHSPSQSWARIDLGETQAIVSQTGSRRLWAELAPVLDSWHTNGRPGIDRHGLTITNDGQHILWLDQPIQVISMLS